jgi:hypothetical protein
VADFLSTTDLASHFHLPLSEQAYEEYQELQEIVQSIQIRQEDKDQWQYIWGAKKIHIQKLLQVPPERDTTTKTFFMDLELRMLQQIESLLMVTPNG